MREITVTIRLTDHEVARIAQNDGLGRGEITDRELAAWGQTQLQARIDNLPEPEPDEDDPDACRECGGPTDDGEGYDGRCGNCADQYADSFEATGN